MQAVKQKLHIKPRLQLPDALLPKLTGRDPEADKAKLLMGDTLSVSFEMSIVLRVFLFCHLVKIKYLLKCYVRPYFCIRQ